METVKTIGLVLALLFGGGQYVGLTLPAQHQADDARSEAAETQANSETIRQTLAQCMEELRACYRECR